MITSIKVGPIRYRVEIDEKMLEDEVNGRIRFNSATISLAKDLAPQVERQVLWHEIVHAILTQGKIEHDERMADVLAYGILQILQDNPQLRALNDD